MPVFGTNDMLHLCAQDNFSRACQLKLDKVFLASWKMDDAISCIDVRLSDAAAVAVKAFVFKHFDVTGRLVQNA